VNGVTADGYFARRAVADSMSGDDEGAESESPAEATAREADRASEAAASLRDRAEEIRSALDRFETGDGTADGADLASVRERLDRWETDADAGDSTDGEDEGAESETGDPDSP
jgi:hypothetical protein